MGVTCQSAGPVGIINGGCTVLCIFRRTSRRTHIRAKGNPKAHPYLRQGKPQSAPVSAPKENPKAHPYSRQGKPQSAPRRLPRHNFITKGVKAGQVRLQTFLESGSLVQSRKESKAGYHPISWQSQGRQNLPLCKMARSCAP